MLQKAMLGSSLVAAIAVAAGCSGDAAPEAQTTPVATAAPSSMEASPSMPSTKPPPAVAPRAPTPEIPLAPNRGGAVLTAPRLVPVTFTGDPMASDIETFVSSLGSSSYWHDTTAEYGVGAAVAGQAVHLSEAAPASIEDAAIKTWLVSRLDGTHAEWPAPDAQTIYVLYYPAATAITYEGATSCGGFGGYHSEAALPGGKSAVYAVIPRCASYPKAGVDVVGLPLLTVTTSHELVEAATDPHPDTAPANFGAGTYFGLPVAEVELADLCVADLQVDPTKFIVPEGLPFTVQRSWSNAAAKGRHDPCVPAAPTPYFNSAPVPVVALPDTKAYFSQVLQGWKLPVGQTTTIDVDLFSDGPTDGPWSVSVADVTNLDPGAPKYLDLKLDRTSGTNGDKLHLTVTALKDGLFDIFEVTSKLGSRTAHWYGVVQTGAPPSGPGGAGGATPSP